jgi:hypothetical protein
VKRRSSALGMTATAAALILALPSSAAYAHDEYRHVPSACDATVFPGIPPAAPSPGRCHSDSGPLPFAANMPAPCVYTDGDIVFQGTERYVYESRADGTKYRVNWLHTQQADGRATNFVPYDYKGKEQINARVPGGSKFYQTVSVIREQAAPPGPWTGKDWYATVCFGIDQNGVPYDCTPTPAEQCRGRSKTDRDDGRNHWDDKEHD